jgi:hypothetical protein
VLARSVIETILLAPLLLVAAAVAVTSWMILLPGAHMTSVWAAGAAAYTTLGCLGPRSRSARRELHQVFSAATSSPLAVAATTLTAGVLAGIVAALILIQTPPTWPLPDLPSMNVHVPRFSPALFHH